MHSESDSEKFHNLCGEITAKYAGREVSQTTLDEMREELFEAGDKAGFANDMQRAAFHRNVDAVLARIINGDFSS